jgi:hypothetical protein
MSVWTLVRRITVPGSTVSPSFLPFPGADVSDFGDWTEWYASEILSTGVVVLFTGRTPQYGVTCLVRKAHS